MIKKLSLFCFLFASLHVLAQDGSAPRPALEAYRKKLSEEIAKYQQELKDLRMICTKAPKHIEECIANHPEISRIDSILSVRYAQRERLNPGWYRGCGRPMKEKAAHSSPEETALSQKLLAKRGNLMWPVDSNCFTIITKKKLPFDRTLKTLVLRDKCTKEMICVSDGKVASAGDLPGGDKFAIVRHGEYLTVYSGFDTLLVSNESMVKEGQPLGKWTGNFSYDDVNFQLWKGTEKENMEEWLAPNQPNVRISRTCGIEYKGKIK